MRGAVRCVAEAQPTRCHQATADSAQSCPPPNPQHSSPPPAGESVEVFLDQRLELPRVLPQLRAQRRQPALQLRQARGLRCACCGAKETGAHTASRQMSRQHAAQGAGKAGVRASSQPTQQGSSSSCPSPHARCPSRRPGRTARCRAAPWPSARAAPRARRRRRPPCWPARRAPTGRPGAAPGRRERWAGWRSGPWRPRGRRRGPAVERLVGGRLSECTAARQETCLVRALAAQQQQQQHKCRASMVAPHSLTSVSVRRSMRP